MDRGERRRRGRGATAARDVAGARAPGHSDERARAAEPQDGAAGAVRGRAVAARERARATPAKGRRCRLYNEHRLGLAAGRAPGSTAGAAKPVAGTDTEKFARQCRRLHGLMCHYPGAIDATSAALAAREAAVERRERELEETIAARVKAAVDDALKRAERAPRSERYGAS